MGTYQLKILGRIVVLAQLIQANNRTFYNSRIIEWLTEILMYNRHATKEAFINWLDIQNEILMYNRHETKEAFINWLDTQKERKDYIQLFNLMPY